MSCTWPHTSELDNEFYDPLSAYIFDLEVEPPVVLKDNYYRLEGLEGLRATLAHRIDSKPIVITPFTQLFPYIKQDWIPQRHRSEPSNFENLGKVEFDSFVRCTLDLKESDLLPVAISIFRLHSDSLDRLSMPELNLINFLCIVKDLYLNNPYHNYRHALDVLHCTSHILKDGKLKSILRDIDVFAILIASICHDIGHLGVNNAYLRDYSVDIALVYNGISPLENYHSFLTNFIIERVPTCALMKNWDATLMREFKRLIADAILATDMANHSRYMALFRSEILLQDKGVLLALILKASDLSNIVRPTAQSRRWSNCLSSEFYLQGKWERSLGFSPRLKYMDEEWDDFPAGQVYFLETFAKPLFDVLVEQFGSLEYLRGNLHENINAWKELMSRNEHTRHKG